MNPDSSTLDQQISADARADVPVDAGAFDPHDIPTVAALCVPPFSRVIVAGLADGSVARALGARMCRVWGVDSDGEAARAAALWCEHTLHGDLDEVALDAELEHQSCDAVLILNTARRVDPAKTLRKAVPLLAPGGRVVLSVPNAIDGSGQIGDRAAAYELLREAGLVVVDEIPMGDRANASGAQVETPYLLIAAPAADPLPVTMPGLAGAAMERLHGLERAYRRLEARNWDLERQRTMDRMANGELGAALDEAREWHRRSAASVTASADALRRAERERARLEQELANAAQEIEQSRVERRFLRDDLAVKDAYVASLREESARQANAERQREAAYREQQLEREQREQAIEAQRSQDARDHQAERRQWEERVTVVAAKLDIVAADRDAEASCARQLAAANAELRQQLECVQEDLHRVHVAIRETLAQPRYVLADRLNAWVRRFRMLHDPLKRLWLARHR